MKNLVKVLIVVLCLALLAVSVVSCGNDPADTTAPEDTTTPAPETTGTPEDTEPEVTTPEETEPEVTTPEETEPEVTTPEETLPEETLPEETTPAETTPTETTPAESTNPSETHQHTYTVFNTVPNCTEDGKVLYLCSCGYSYEEKGEEALGHAWLLIDTLPSTCMTTGITTHRCVVCEELEQRSLPLGEHDFTKVTATVSAESDPSGKGYELVGCSVCPLMTKVEANHTAGHAFGEDRVCLCGAVSGFAEETIGCDEFDDTDRVNIEYTSNFTPKTAVIENGAWRASGQGSSAQPAFRGAEQGVFVDMLDGEYAGQTLDAAVFSMEFYYTGSLASNNGVFLSWRSRAVGQTSGYTTEFEVTLSPSGSKLAISGELGSVVLEPSTEDVKNAYTLNLIADFTTNTFRGVVSGDAIEDVVIFEEVPTNAFAGLFGLWIRCNSIWCEDPEVFSFFVESLKLNCAAAVVDTTNVDTEWLCDHQFSQEPLVDKEHPADEKWNTYTCEICHRYYVDLALTRETHDISSLDFEDGVLPAEDSQLHLVNLKEEYFADSPLGEGKAWKVSSTSQIFFRKTGFATNGGTVIEQGNSVFSQVLSGTDADGNNVDCIDFSFDFFYTGSYTNTTANTFWNFQAGSTILELSAVAANGGVKIYDKATPDTYLILEANKAYRINVRLIPETNRFVITVEGDDAMITLCDKAASKSILDLTQMGFFRSAFYNANGDYAFYVDNMKITYDTLS